MMISGDIQYVQSGNPFNFREGDQPEDTAADESFTGTIPRRYRDGRGGIDLEQVRRDQRLARQQVVRAMIGHLTKLRNGS